MSLLQAPSEASLALIFRVAGVARVEPKKKPRSASEKACSKVSTWRIIEHMIDVRALDGTATLAGAEASLHAVMAAEADQLVLAAHWADLHDPAALAPVETEAEHRRRRWDGEYGVRPGGAGTPEVLASCFAELGAVLQTSAGGAKHLVADALDLRHRLPSLWTEVRTGRVRGWRARRVASATRHLPLAALDEVDEGLAGLLSSLPWARFEAVLEATVARADPAGAAGAEAEAGARRFVSLARPGPADAHGLKTLIARGEALDILTLLAAVNRIAEILAAEGDSNPLPVRRSKAVGILGQPDRALALLAAHRDDPDESSVPEQEPSEDEPGEQEPEPDRPELDEPGTRSLDLTGASANVASRGSVAQVRVQLFVHLTDAALAGTDPGGVCRIEGVGPVTVSGLRARLRAWLDRADARITVRPVAVAGEAAPVDAYEIPQAVRRAVLLRSPASAFPWSSCLERRFLQLDHRRPYLPPDRGGPPGQTDPRLLIPLAGPEHQSKTSGRWRVRSPVPGVCLWRSPHGWVHLVTNQGTFDLGHDTRAQAMWHACADVEAALAA